MTLNNRIRAQLLAHCGQLHDDDGVDPREFFSKKKRPPKQDHSTQRLCRQVAQTLSFVLSGEMADEVLQALRVVCVDPAPNAGQLAVSLEFDGPCDPQRASDAMTRLERVGGRLRSEVAAAICRKRAPRLLFRFVGPEVTTGGAS